MIYYFKPYAVNGRLFEAYSNCADLVKNESDFICFLDGDTMFLTKDWGHIIQAYTEKYKNAGMFTCYASRCSYMGQIPKIGDNLNTDLAFHIEVARQLEKKFRKDLIVKTFNRKTSGHMLLIKKSIWNQIYKTAFQRVTRRDKKILGVDSAISIAVLKTGRDILLMRAVYLLHLFRLDERKH